MYQQLLHIFILVLVVLQPGTLLCFGRRVVDPYSARAARSDCTRIDPLCWELAIAKTGAGKSYLFILGFVVVIIVHVYILFVVVVIIVVILLVIIILVIFSNVVRIIGGRRVLALAFTWRSGLRRAHRTSLWRLATVRCIQLIGAGSRKDATRRGSGTYAAELGVVADVDIF